MQIQLNIPFEEQENKVCNKWLFNTKCSDCLFMVMCNLEREEERQKKVNEKYRDQIKRHTEKWTCW